MVVPRFVQAAKTNQPINIFGDGTQSRVFCHVQDVVAAILKIADEEKTIGQVFNIGGQGEISILELAEKIILRTGSSSDLVFTPYSEAYPEGFEDMQRRVPDISKIKEVTGWVPNKNLDNIIDDVAATF